MPGPSFTRTVLLPSATTVSRGSVEVASLTAPEAFCQSKPGSANAWSRTLRTVTGAAAKVEEKIASRPPFA